MVAVGARLVKLGAVGVGGVSLLLFAYFVLFGSPFSLRIANSHAAGLAFDSLLCLGFFVQHSGMIRRGPKNRLAKRVGARYQPAVYSIASGAALIILVLLWQPTDEFLFRLRGGARWFSACLALLALAGFVWGVRSLGTFDPFGTLPIKAALPGTGVAPDPLVTRGPYRYVRHPLYLFMLVLIWSTPRLSTDQLLFNLLWTGWIVLGTKLEERDLLADFGQTYREYQLTVPMLIPSPRRIRENMRSRPAV